jgi:NCAIR mutase (PurE)-related protein
METAKLKKKLLEFRKGRCSLDQLLSDLKHMPFEDLRFAKIDHHRALRKGFPEVVFCEGKSPEQIIPILQTLTKQHEVVLATRVNPHQQAGIVSAIPGLKYHPSAKALVWKKKKIEKRGLITVVTGGTSDISVAEEAALTAELTGNRVQRCYDMGVAGLHRLLASRSQWEKTRAFIVVAGMDGVLPTVLGGLTSKPIVAVPTSVGYGACFQGIAPLLTMLNSCAPGVAVMNIDNGFGAGYFANLINK